jgi:oxaloacetate decarboxylase alpha subunit
MTKTTTKDRIEFVDVTLRDGHQSLWAERMTTGMMLPVIGRLDRAGFIGLEVLSPSFLGKCVRDLLEDPIARIRMLKERAPNTPLRVNAGGLNVFGTDQQAMVELFWQVMFKAGIEEARVSDSWNDPKVWTLRAGAAAKAGIRPIINITYSISPLHTDEYYAERTRAAVKLKPFRICLKDPGGLLTPERTRDLVPLMMKHAAGIPIEMHTHCSTGLGPLCVLEAVKQGIRIVNTSLPPLVDDASLPSLFNVAANLRALGYATGVDEDSLQEVARHFTVIARREGLPIGVPVAYDHAQYVHQVPGGMISNLRHQLREVGAEAKLPAALEETVRVRAEFGYPIMVTPLSQFVGSQAALNVMTGQRYGQVSDQTIRYALGHFGGDVENIMDREVRAKILDRPRARELAAVKFEQLPLERIRADLDAAGASDEDLVYRYLMRKDDIARMHAATTGPVKEYLTDTDPLVSLVAELSKLKGANSIHISKPGFNLTLGRNA